MRTLAITQNITVDGSIEMLGDWFDPQGQGDSDNSDLLEELHRQDRDADGLLVGRRTFQDLRGYWPQQSDDSTGITAYLENGGTIDVGQPYCLLKQSCPGLVLSRFTDNASARISFVSTPKSVSISHAVSAMIARP